MGKILYSYCDKCDKVQKHIFCSCNNTNIPLETIQDAPKKDYYVLGSDFGRESSGCYIKYNALKDMVKKGDTR